MHYYHFEKEHRRRRIRIASYLFLGLLAAATGVVVYQALSR